MPPHPLPDAARRRLRRLAWRARRPLAAVCAGLAVLLAVQQLRPPGPPTVVVLVAARDLPVGTTLTERDVEERTVAAAVVPPALVPTGRARDDGTGSAAGGGATDRASGDRMTGAPDGDATAALLPGVAALLGRRAAVDVPAGLPLVPGLLVATDADPPAGTVVVPVRFADPGVAAVLRPGVRVDVVAAPLADGAEPERLAQGATVLARPAAAAPERSGEDATALTRAGDEDVPVLLAVTPEESVRLGGSAGSRVLGAVIVG